MSNRLSHKVQGIDRHLHGWKRDRPDHRDYLFRDAVRTKRRGPIPAHVDQQNICPPVVDQANIGSCTAHSTSYHAETLYLKQGKPLVKLSRLFPYYMTRVKIEGVQPGDDSGCFIRDVMKCWAQYGDCREELWPYDEPDRRMAIEPPKEAQEDASNHQILTYFRMTTLVELRQCLAEGYTFVGGFSVPENMMSEECARTGVIHFPGADESYVGGHAIHFVGYDDAKGLLKFQNSWGDNWGDKGYGYLPYAFVTENLADDFWTVRTEEMP